MSESERRQVLTRGGATGVACVVLAALLNTAGGIRFPFVLPLLIIGFTLVVSAILYAFEGDRPA